MKVIGRVPLLNNVVYLDFPPPHINRLFQISVETEISTLRNVQMQFFNIFLFSCLGYSYSEEPRLDFWWKFFFMLESRRKNICAQTNNPSFAWNLIFVNNLQFIYFILFDDILARKIKKMSVVSQEANIQ